MTKSPRGEPITPFEEVIRLEALPELPGVPITVATFEEIIFITLTVLESAMCKLANRESKAIPRGFANRATEPTPSVVPVTPFDPATMTGVGEAIGILSTVKLSVI